MNRRETLARMVGGFGIFAAVAPRPHGLIRLRVVRLQHGVVADVADTWRIFDADTGYEIGKDIPASRWAKKFGAAEIGQPFHFTVFKRDERGRIVLSHRGTVQERRRGVIVSKV